MMLVPRWRASCVAGSGDGRGPRFDQRRSDGYSDGSPALVAQLDRASDYGSEGWGFESSRARRLKALLRRGFRLFWMEGSGREMGVLLTTR